jgi:hypothetical protein
MAYVSCRAGFLHPRPCVPHISAGPQQLPILPLRDVKDRACGFNPLASEEHGECTPPN